MLREAQWYHPLINNSVQCLLCPHECILNEGKTGICRVRTNVDGKLMTEANGFVSSISVDPIEKKPLYHFFPGSKILSIGTYGCNLRCFFCQNCTISQKGAEPDLPKFQFTPEQIVRIALDTPDNIGIAFTYNEPVVWFEYMYDIARLAKQSGLVTVMVTNGFINPVPLENLIAYIDAFSVDLKAFNSDFYEKVTSSHLEPVKATLKQIKESGKHLEIVNLVIPGLNDNDADYAEMIGWISTELGEDTALHISRYFPNYKMITEATPISILRKVKRIAESGLRYVYAGNVYSENNDTNCKFCNNILITRHLYYTKITGLAPDGSCLKCGNNFLKKI